MNSITENISIEELIELKPASVKYLSEKGIKCIACGEPVWGTLKDAVMEKGFSNEDLKLIIDEVNRL